MMRIDFHGRNTIWPSTLIRISQRFAQLNRHEFRNASLSSMGIFSSPLLFRKHYMQPPKQQLLFYNFWDIILQNQIFYKWGATFIWSWEHLWSREQRKCFICIICWTRVYVICWVHLYDLVIYKSPIHHQKEEYSSCLLYQLVFNLFFI